MRAKEKYTYLRKFVDIPARELNAAISTPTERNVAQEIGLDKE